MAKDLRWELLRDVIESVVYALLATEQHLYLVIALLHVAMALRLVIRRIHRTG